MFFIKQFFLWRSKNPRTLTQSTVSVVTLTSSWNWTLQTAQENDLSIAAAVTSAKPQSFSRRAQWAVPFTSLDTVAAAACGNPCSGGEFFFSVARMLVHSDPCCCSVSQSCLTLCDPLDYSMPDFSVLHYLPEFAQTHVIQPSHPLSSPFPPALSVFQHQGLFQ